jgi:sterol desaturase/sphingolipid hydroxylase (fatty acid hydroxylase superfamily)
MIQVVVSTVIGSIAWTLLEYVLHRWLGHDPRTRPNPFAAEHVRHHSEGNYFAPTYKKVIVGLVITPLVAIPAVAVAGFAVGLAFVAGFVTMYVTYEVVHRRDHTHPGIGAYGRFLRRHHFYHHFVDPGTNHGVTSPAWDWVFGTLRVPGIVRVPRKLAMPWLFDPVSGEIDPAHTRHYEISGRV